MVPGLANAGAVLENWLADFDYMRRNTDWGMLVYTFHPDVSGRGHRMMMMERLIDGLAARGAEFLTLDEVQRAFRARRAPGGGG